MVEGASVVVHKLIEAGVSLLPVDPVNKNPYVKKWRGEPPLSGVMLFEIMDRFRTNAVCMVLGSASNGIVCLDIDSKHYPGIDARIFSDLKELYPELYEKLRIEKTLSNGYHFLYRLSGKEELPGCTGLSSRPRTEKEKADNPKNKNQNQCFIEIKCEGGLSQCYPSPGYSVVKKPLDGSEFNVLDWEEHVSLVSLMKTYDECIVVSKVKFTKKETDFYSENPYECYDRSIAGSLILEELGWTEYKVGGNGKYIYYQKPGKKDNDVSAGFNREKNLYTIWTTSTDIPAKSYSPSNLKANVSFNDDKSQLYAWLVSEGYGKLKPQVEDTIIKRSLRSGRELPSNFSEDGKKKFEEQKQVLTEKYPYGTFWIQEEDSIRISRELFYRVASNIGYRKSQFGTCLLIDHIIKKIDEGDFFDGMKEYIKEDEIEIYSVFEAFLQNSGAFSIKRLKTLENDKILRSTKEISYKFYRNCYVKITKDEIEQYDYNSLEGLIWYEDIKDRDFIVDNDWKKGLYYDYLNKATKFNDYLLRCMGFYAHDYRDEESYMVIATEEVENPKDGAGSGKNVFWSLFSLITSFKSTPASQINKDNKLFASWNGQRIFALADMDKKFNLIFFKDIINGNSVVRKLYKDEYDIPIEDMPKLCGSSNYSFDDADPGVKRRVRQIEFSDFFTKAGGVKRHYGKMFPKDWEAQEYVWFDNIMVLAIQKYLEADCVIELLELTEGGWHKQFEQKYSHLHEFIKEHIKEYVMLEKVPGDKIRADYKTFIIENNIKNGWSMHFLNKAFEDYCAHHSIGFIKDAVWKDGPVLAVRGKIFGNHEQTEQVEPSNISFNNNVSISPSDTDTTDLTWYNKGEKVDAPF